MRIQPSILPVDSGSRGAPVYYNEIEDYPARWVDRQIEEQLLPSGRIDTRSIEHVSAGDVAGRTAHFFAGMGVWAAALRLAGVPDESAVWTGSCPCQPFSDMGPKTGEDDDRHLWPVWCKLIDQCRPAIVFGEQVATRAGRAWFARVRSDLEALGYAVGCADLCAASVGAPQRRQRLFWVACSNSKRRGQLGATWLHDRREQWDNASRRGSGGIWDAWREVELRECTDGKRRPVKPGAQLLVDGYASRCRKLRAYGNAIVAPLAAVFIRCALGSIAEAAE